MKKLALVLLLVCGTAFADDDSRSSNVNTNSLTDNSRTTNTNTAYGGLGGNATSTSSANGGTHIQTATQTTANTNINTPTAIATQGQQQGQGQLQGQGQIQGQGQTNGNGNNWNYTNVQPDSLRTVGIAPSILANPTAPCRIQGGAGGGWLGGALSFSGSLLDEGCDARADTMLLISINQPGAAIARACQKAELAKALGPLCPAPVAETKKTSTIKTGTGGAIQSGKF